MKRTETIKLNIAGEIIPIRFSILSFMGYSEMFGKEISQCKTVEDQIQYFYAAYKAGCNYEKAESYYTYEEWLQLLDDYPEALTELTNKMLEANDTKKK